MQSQQNFRRWRRWLAGRRNIEELTANLHEQDLNGVDISEVYNPARFTSRAKHFGLHPGGAYDLTQLSDDGEHWDFDREDHRVKCEMEIDREEPALLIGSPFCSAFSSIMSLNWSKMSEEKKKSVWDRACSHMKLTFKLYRK